MTLQQLAAQREALFRAICRGVLTVKAKDTSVTYKSNKDMRGALAMLDEGISLPEGKGKVRRIVACGDDGL